MASGTNTHNALFFSRTPLLLHSLESACKEIGPARPSVPRSCINAEVVWWSLYGHAWTPERFCQLCSVCVLVISFILAKLCFTETSAPVIQIFFPFFLQHPPLFFNSSVFAPWAQSFPLQNEAKKSTVLISHSLAVSLNLSCCFSCLFRHLHNSVYSHNSWSLKLVFSISFFLFFKVECLSRVVCWSEGPDRESWS